MTDLELTSVDAATGLTRGQVKQRVAAGLVNDVPEAPSRTTADIVRSNVFTRFNFLLGALLAVIVVVAPIQDALFGVVLVVNTLIGIVQELRAKQTLDRLALLNAPRATVVRDGQAQTVAVNEVVRDDILQLRPGDQLVVDGVAATSEGLEINEALLTGESDPVPKQPGDRCLSGSFVSAGEGRMQATKVGADAYAVQLAEQARRFTLVRSELKHGIDWILAAISWVIGPAIALLMWSQLQVTDGIRPALAGAVAGGVGMIPQGLVLLTSMAFALGVVRLGRRQVLVQELPAVEGLARVDTVCLDKTGTLTEGRLRLHDVIPIASSAQSASITDALGALGAVGTSPNATQEAIAASHPDPGWRAVASVPFSSARKWSGTQFADHGTWALGAPEIVGAADPSVMAEADSLAAGGKRVVMLAHSPHRLDPESGSVPHQMEPVALVVLGDAVRGDAAATLRYFAAQGVAVKIISGDHAETVGAIAREVGVPGAERAVDARHLPDEPNELASVMEETAVFGRVTPHQKRAMVAALQRSGHIVAMTGDGVNDVLALKDSDIGIAMGSGSSATRAVAQLVLIDGRFDTIPHIVGEGRRVIANIERVANLFVTKTIYALALVLAVGLVGRVFPFLPRHLTLVGSVTIGIPAFFLALEPTARRARTGFVKRVLRFAVPTGLAAAAATYAAYELAISEDTSLTEARTMATLVLAAIGLFALGIVSRPLNGQRRTLIAAMGVLLLLVLVSRTWRDFFEIDLPGPTLVLAAVGIVSITGVVMFGALRLIGWGRQVPEMLQRSPDLTLRGSGPRLRHALEDWWDNRLRFWREPDD